MSSQLDETQNLRAEKITVGLSTIQGVSLLAGEQWAILKYSSGGSLEIGGPSLTWGAGYLFNASETLSFPLTNTFYLTATGATVVAFLLRGVSNGNT